MISQTRHAPRLRRTTAGTPSLKSFLAWILTLQAIWRERRALKSMSHTQLDDIGQTRKTAINESRRPVWDAPNRWLL